MMKLKVIQAFHDKYTDKFYPIGSEITVEDDRGKELIGNSLGLVEVIEETKVAKKPKKA